MKIFPNVSPLLQVLDRQGLFEFGDDWDVKVCEAIRDLRNRYTQLLDRNRKLIDYSSLPVQMAYAFMYVGANSNCLTQILTTAEAAAQQPIFIGPEMRVTSWGGGPGSDLLALVTTLRNTLPDERPRKIIYRVLDKQPNWHEILKTVAKLQAGTIEIEVSFEAVDVTIPDQWKGISNEHDDILIMNFFVSEVCSLRESKSVRECLSASLRSLKSGSVLVFNDSNAYSFHSYFDNLTGTVGGFGALVSESGQLDVSPDFDDFFRHCMGRFDSTSPKLTSNAAYRVFRKR
jgi:hypothetical protein